MKDEVEIKIEYFETDEKDPLERKPENDDSCQQEKLECEAVQNSTYCEAEDEQGYNKQAYPKKQTWYETIDDTGKYICKFCMRTYHTVQTLRRHVIYQHTTEGEELKKEVQKNKRNSKFKCHICNTNLTSLPNLKEHMKRLHSDKDSNSFCHKCQATFNNNSLMSAHLLSEHKINYKKMYSCNICGYRTGKTSHFKQHQVIHTEKKVYQCKFCDYSTSNSSNLKIHERIHSNCKPYSCSYIGCDYKAAARSALQSHLLKHEPEKNLLYCTKCPYKTVYKQSLKNHTESHVRNMLNIVL